MAKTRRNSKQRQVVLEELRKMKSHPTAAELHDIVRTRLPSISLGTVYRNLELLAGDGLVRKLEHGSGRARFDGDLEQHLHVVCEACGRVDDVAGKPVDVGTDCPAAPDGYEIFGLRVEYSGLCPDCTGRVPDEEIAQLRNKSQNNH